MYQSNSQFQQCPSPRATPGVLAISGRIIAMPHPSKEKVCQSPTPGQKNWFISTLLGNNIDSFDCLVHINLHIIIIWTRYMQSRK